MSVVNQLSTELTNLVTESRRRNTEIKHAAERSLSTLKKFDGSSDEVAFLKGLSSNADFITPFLLSCSTRNAKFSTIAIQCLNKLIQYRAIPISKLDLLLDSFIEATHLAVDIQLKVLQTLPTTFQIYGQFLNGPLVAKLLLVCSMLQSPSKIPMVVNTSAATQQQIVLSLFDKLVEEDKSDAEKEFSVKIDEGEELKVATVAYDTYRILNDLCSLIEHQSPSFLSFKYLPESFGFELLENVLSNYTELFLSHIELGFLVRTRITPLLLRSFSNHKDFLIVVRVSRIMILLFKTQISILEIEAEVMLSLLTHAISKESSLPYWKKILSLEIFDGVFKEFDLVKYIFSSYDNHEDKKKVIGNFLGVCSDIVKEEWATRLLQINDIVMVPNSEQAITLQNSIMKIPYIDLLDKNEAPTAPKPYTLYLILSCTNTLAEGIGNFVRDISTNGSNTFTFFSELTSGEQELKDANQVKALITSNSKSIISIGSEFLYASLGSELFHALIRALQKLCHAAGVLGLSAEKNSLLTLFSVATISNNRRNIKSLSISETIVETFSNSIAAPPPSPSVARIHHRYINSRHIICFRALVSLVISLGPTLKTSWKFLLPTFQWFDYYLNGPSSTFSFKDLPSKPELSSSDMKIAESSFSKLYESFADYENEAFTEGLIEFLDLAKIVVFEKTESSEPIFDDKISVCPYNRDYLMKKLAIITKVNARRFLENGNKNWNSIVQVLTDICTSPKVEADLRVVANSTFNQSIKFLAAVAFSSDSPFDRLYIESELLNSLENVVDRLLSSLSETHLSNSESEMIHDTLETLNELLDRFGTHFTHSWEAVVHIIDCPFKFFEVSKNAGSQKQLLKSAFEILQLVLNDFLQTIPLKILIKVIDVLGNFINQEYELNISFSAISYYWLMSDYFRQLASTVDNSSQSCLTNDALLEKLQSSSEGEVNVHGLWLYLLSSLVDSFYDSRAEVRNGAMQTFFRIVDSHGIFLNWDDSYHLVVKKVLDIKLDHPSSNDGSSLKDSLSIVLKGLTELYHRFFLESTKESYWEGLLEFLAKLLTLQSTDITFLVYKSFHEISASFKTVDPKIFDLLFGFWSSQNITYVVVDTDTYQKCIVEIMGAFQNLYKLSDLSILQLEKSFSIFNSAIRFPFLPSYTKDVQKATELQSVILENLKIVDLSKDPAVMSLVLSHLANVILLPFQTRTRILKKLQGKGKQVPSFIAVSKECLRILGDSVRSIEDFKPLIPNKSFVKIFKNLLETVQGEVEDESQQLNLSNNKLWKEALTILFELSSKVVPLLEKPFESTTEDSRSELWSLIIESTISSIPVSNNNRDEEFNSKVFGDFKSKILPFASQEILPDKSLENFVFSLWKSSFMYQNDEIEKYLLDSFDSPNQISQFILSASFNDYTTEPIKALSQENLRTTCLKDLFEICDFSNVYTSDNSEAAQRIFKISLPYLVSRLVLLLKRYSGSQKLLNNGPIASVQQREQVIAFKSLLNLISNIPNEKASEYKPLWEIFPYVLQNLSSLSRNKTSEILLRKIINEFYKQS